MNPVDGNALAGPLFELFRVDMTTAESQCLGCHTLDLLARASVFISEMGAVMRCRNCGAVQAVLVDIAGTISLKLPGVALIRSSEPVAP